MIRNLFHYVHLGNSVRSKTWLKLSYRGKEAIIGASSTAGHWCWLTGAWEVVAAKTDIPLQLIWPTMTINFAWLATRIVEDA